MLLLCLRDITLQFMFMRICTDIKCVRAVGQTMHDVRHIHSPINIFLDFTFFLHIWINIEFQQFLKKIILKLFAESIAKY